MNITITLLLNKEHEYYIIITPINFLKLKSALI